MWGNPEIKSPARREMELLEKDVEKLLPWLLMPRIRLDTGVFLVQVAVEHGEADEERHTDQILYALDVLVVINECEDFLDRSNLL
jgi:hypothetical protein